MSRRMWLAVTLAACALLVWFGWALVAIGKRPDGE